VQFRLALLESTVGPSKVESELPGYLGGATTRAQDGADVGVFFWQDFGRMK
jgi:hypothetical protein